MTINLERLAAVFTTLCEIDSPSKQEGRVAAYLKSLFTDMGAEVLEDDSASITGSDCGNLFVHFPEGGLLVQPDDCNGLSRGLLVALNKVACGSINVAIIRARYFEGFDIVLL